MKEQWQQLNAREQKLVLFIAPFLLIVFFYFLAWQPLNDALVAKQQKVVNREALLNLVQESSQRYLAHKGSKKSGSKGSVSSVVNRSAGQHQITLSRIQAKGGGVQVWIDEVPFNRLLQWLEYMLSQEGLIVENIDMSITDTKGVVRIRRLQLGKN